MNNSRDQKRNAMMQKMNRNIRPRQTILPKKLLITSVVLVFFFAMGVIFYFQFGKVDNVKAIASGDYRTMATGNWNSISTWEKYNGTSWVAAVATPTSADGTITILNGH